MTPPIVQSFPVRLRPSRYYDLCRLLTASFTPRHRMFYRFCRVRETSPGTHTFFPSMSPPSLLCRIPCSYWTSTCKAVLSSVFSLKWFLCVGAEVCLHLPSALLNLTARTLVFSHILPTAGWIQDFHPLKRAPAGRTLKSRRNFPPAFRFTIFSFGAVFQQAYLC